MYGRRSITFLPQRCNHSAVQLSVWCSMFCTCSETYSFFPHSTDLGSTQPLTEMTIMEFSRRLAVVVGAEYQNKPSFPSLLCLPMTCYGKALPFRLPLKKCLAGKRFAGTRLSEASCPVLATVIRLISSAVVRKPWCHGETNTYI